MALLIKVNDLKINNMDMDMNHGLMDHAMKAIIKMGKSLELGNLLGQIIIVIMENSYLTTFTVKEDMNEMMEEYIMVNE